VGRPPVIRRLFHLGGSIVLLSLETFRRSRKLPT